MNIYDFIILSSFVKCSQRVSLFLRVCLQLWTKACMHVIFWFERRTRDACTLFLVERSILLGFWSITVCLPNLLTRDVFTVAYKTPFKKHFYICWTMINWNLVEIPMYETIQLYISKIWIKKNATSNHWLSTGRHKGLLEHEWCWNEFLLNDAYHDYITLIFDNLINSFLSWQFWI